MVSLRLSKQLEQWLSRAARMAGVSKSAFVRQCIEDRKQSDESRPTAYELGKDLFGKYGSGRTDLARNAKKIVREKIHAKARRNRLRAGGETLRS